MPEYRPEARGPQSTPRPEVRAPERRGGGFLGAIRSALRGLGFDDAAKWLSPRRDDAARRNETNPPRADNAARPEAPADTDAGPTPEAGPSWDEVKNGETVLRVGATGPAVERTQELLTEAGFTIPVTGVYDDATKKMVDVFQGARGLGRDGAVGKNTAAKLEQAAALPAPTSEGLPVEGTIEWLPGTYHLTHYTFALESDAIHQRSENAAEKVSAPGLNEKYRRSFLGGEYGVKMQGTGIAENGKVIRYAGGGRYAYGYGGAAGTPEAWKTVAVDPSVIPLGSKVVLQHYGEHRAFEARDTGGAIRGRRIDVFAGAVPIETAYALGSKDSKVGVVRNR